MCLGLQHQQFSPVLPAQAWYPSSLAEANELIEEYREQTIQCLLIENYLQCMPYTIETLILYMHIEYLRSEDSQVEVWAVLGVIIRLALRMGYHRDPSHFSRISAFQSEMRRRNWAEIVQLDIIASQHFGLPRMINISQSDTKEPLNLLDSDLDLDMAELPPERPPTVETSILFFNSKNKLYEVYAAAFDSLLSAQPVQYSEVMRLDEVLNETYKGIPSTLMMRPLMDSIMDSDDIVIGRLFISALFYRTQCTLHRRYITAAVTDPRYAYSREICVKAALAVLGYQTILDQEIQPGGRFHESAWRISLIVKQDFLLATSILCLELSNDLKASMVPLTPASNASWRQEVIETLQRSHGIWRSSSEMSHEAKKAARTTGFVLKMANAMEGSSESDDGPHNANPSAREELGGRAVSWQQGSEEQLFRTDGFSPGADWTLMDFSEFLGANEVSMPQGPDDMGIVGAVITATIQLG